MGTADQGGPAGGSVVAAAEGKYIWAGEWTTISLPGRSVTGKWLAHVTINLGAIFTAVALLGWLATPVVLVLIAVAFAITRLASQERKRRSGAVDRGPLIETIP
ncbi:hypothetical protein [Mycolicibacterium sp.]|uniref:hypothetical protein n=1 Tax=Mycolicibacterium sp. TaxID=2320850 RepID=UPI0037C73414